MERLTNFWNHNRLFITYNIMIIIAFLLESLFGNNFFFNFIQKFLSPCDNIIDGYLRNKMNLGDENNLNGNVPDHNENGEQPNAINNNNNNNVQNENSDDELDNINNDNNNPDNVNNHEANEYNNDNNNEENINQENANGQNDNANAENDGDNEENKEIENTINNYNVDN